MLDLIRRIASLTLMLSICLCNPYPGVAQQLPLKAHSFPKVLSALEDSSGNFLLLKLDSKTPLTAPLIHYLPGMDGQTVMVAEFENVLWLNSSQLIEPQFQEIDSIRLGQFQSNPPIFRISIATSNPTVLRKIEFQHSGSTLVIKLRASKVARVGSISHAGGSKSTPIRPPTTPTTMPYTPPVVNSHHQNIQVSCPIPDTAIARHSPTTKFDSPHLVPSPNRTGPRSETLSSAPASNQNGTETRQLERTAIANNADSSSCPIPNTEKQKEKKLPFTPGGLFLQAKSQSKQAPLAPETPPQLLTPIASSSSKQALEQQQQQQVTAKTTASFNQFELRGPIEIPSPQMPATAQRFGSEETEEQMPKPAPNRKIMEAKKVGTGSPAQNTVARESAESKFTHATTMPLAAPNYRATPNTVPSSKVANVHAGREQSNNANDTPIKANSDSRSLISKDSTRARAAIEADKMSALHTSAAIAKSNGTTKANALSTASTPGATKTNAISTASMSGATKTNALSAASMSGATKTNAISTASMPGATKATALSTAAASKASTPSAGTVGTTKTEQATHKNGTKDSTTEPLEAPNLVQASAISTQMPPAAPPINSVPADPTTSVAENPQIMVEGRNPITLRFKFKDAVRYTSFKLSDPPRYVIDLSLPASDAPRNALTADKNDFLKGIRFGTPDEEGTSTRIVLDLEKDEVNIKEEMDASQSLLTLTLQPGNATPAIASVKGKTVVIDAGHGGSDPGAQRGDNNEKDMTLAIAMKLKKVLEEQGVRTVMTRSDDTFVSLEDRVKITNETAPDAFVSVHINSLETDRDIQGIETYYQTEQSKILANKIHENLVGELQVPDRFVRKAKFYVINHTPHPAVLAEVGFISNKGERDKLISSDYQLRVADSIGQGVILFLSGATQMPPIASRAVIPGSQTSSAAISSTSKQILAQDTADVVKKNLAKEPAKRNNPTTGNKQVAQKVTDQKTNRMFGNSNSRRRHYLRHIAARRS